jgi:hypothetical protein
MRIRIRRIKPRFYVFVGIVVLIPIIILLANMGGSKTAFVDWGIMSSSSKKDVVLLRSETVVKAESAGKVVYVAEEGQRVAQGDKVVEVYQAGYDQKSLDDYDALQKKIYEYQIGALADIKNENLSTIDQAIKGKQNQLNAVYDTEDRTETLKLEEELNQLIELRKAHLRQIVPLDSQLNELYLEEQNLLIKINAWKKDELAPEAGIVSFYFDGNEAALNPQDLDKLTVKDIQTLLQGSASYSNQQEAKIDQPLYRLVSSNTWYVAILGDENSDLALSETYDIVFEGMENATYIGQVVVDKDKGKDHLTILSVEQDIQPLLNVREAKASIGKSQEGFMIPKDALYEKSGQKGVYIVNGREETFVGTEVLEENDESYLIRELNGGETIKVNQAIKCR